MKFSQLLLLASLLSTAAAFGRDGPGVSGGGDWRCADYVDLAINVATELNAVDPKLVASKSRSIHPDRLLEIAQNLKCLPANRKLERQAVSSVIEIVGKDGESSSKVYQTELMANEWENIKGDYEKIRLVTHELSILAEYETDGVYHRSNQIMELLRDSSSLFKFKLRAEEIFLNSDGSIIFRTPFYVQNGVKYFYGEWIFGHGETPEELQKMAERADGICKHLGMNSRFDADPRKENFNRFYQIETAGGNSTTYNHNDLLIVDKEGQIINIQHLIEGIGRDFYISQIRCK